MASGPEEKVPDREPLTAPKLIGEIAGACRFSSNAKLARGAGVAPIHVSSGKINRHRLDRSAASSATICSRPAARPESSDHTISFLI